MLKEGAKYMLVANIYTEDGLVNGATGILMRTDTQSFTKASDKSIKVTRPTRVWLEFEDTEIGAMTRNESRRKKYDLRESCLKFGIHGHQ